MTFDRLFKTAILIVLSALLYLAWGMKNTGRYVYNPRVDKAQDILLDIQTGRMFYLNVGNEVHDAISVEEDPLRGAMSSYWAFGQK
jgi:hypothetical protein